MRVVAVDGDRALLEGDRASACRACAARAGCGAGALAELVGGGVIRVDVRRSAPVQPGDRVVVALPGSTFLGAALLAYLLPPAALALVASMAVAFGLPDGQVALLCVPVLALSLLPLARAERRGRMQARLRIVHVDASEAQAAE